MANLDLHMLSKLVESKTSNQGSYIIILIFYPCIKYLVSSDGLCHRDKQKGNGKKMG